MYRACLPGIMEVGYGSQGASMDRENVIRT